MHYTPQDKARCKVGMFIAIRISNIHLSDSVSNVTAMRNCLVETPYLTDEGNPVKTFPVKYLLTL